MEVPDDASLLRRYADDRDQAAFAEVVRRYIDLVYSVALRSVGGDRHLAEDVAQEVFVIVSRQAGALSRHAALEGWIHTATRYQAIHAIRREVRRQERERKYEAMNPSQPAIDPEIEWDKLRPVLDEVLGQLSSSDREAILLRFYLRRPFRELGARLGLTEDAARRRVDRALEKLKRAFARRGLASTETALAAVLSVQAVCAAPPGLAGAAFQAALTAGPVGGAGWTALLHLMATSKTIAIAGGVVLLAAAALTEREFQLARQGEAALPAAQKALAETRHRLDTLRTLPPAGTPPPVAVANPPAPPAARSASPARGNDTSLQAGSRLEAAYPEIRKADLAWFKAQIDSGYRQFFADQKLTPDQIAQFEQIRLSLGMDHGINMYTFESTDTPISVAAAKEQLGSLLGMDGLQALADYERGAVSRRFVAMVGENAFDGGEPLSGDQTGALARLVSSDSASFQAGHSASLATLDWGALAAQAQGLLSPGQLEALQAAAQQTRFNLEFAAAARGGNSR